MRIGRLLIVVLALVSIVACSRGLTEDEVRDIIQEHTVPSERDDSGKVSVLRTPTPAPTARPSLGTKESPYPFGQPGIVQIRPDETWEITVLDADPEGAKTIMADWAGITPPPREGYKYFLIKLRVTYRGNLSAEFDDMHSLRASGGAAVYNLYDVYCGGGPISDPLPDDVELISAGTVEGNICFEIPSHDVDSLVFIVEGYTPYGSDYWWFSLEKPSRQ